MSKSINIGQPLFNNIEGHPFVLGPQGPYRTKEEAIEALIKFYETKDDIPNGQECIIDGVKFIWRDDDLYESLAIKTINESQTDLNSYSTPGTYSFNSIRNNNFANLPINNNNPNASITGELVVYSSVEGTTTYRSIIGQILFLSNAEGNETKIYTRSANKTSKDGGATYEVIWGDWQVCQGMKEVGLVDSYDSFIDNGMYSGIYNNNGMLETFVIITINDYIAKSQFNQPKAISQLKYALNTFTNKSELSIRVGGGENFTWDKWKPVFDEENITTQINNIQNQLNTLTDDINSGITDITNKIDEKAPKIGYAPDLKVNFANELTGRNDATAELIGNLRPTGIKSIGDGNATITKIKGNSVVWNQLQSKTQVTGTISTSQTHVTVINLPVSPGIYYINCHIDTNANIKSGSFLIWDGSTSITASNITVTKNVLCGIVRVPIKGQGIFNIYHDTVSEKQPFTASLVLHNLTLMFGADNEPDTIENFEEKKPLGITNDYNEGTIVSFQGGNIKSVGFNAWDEVWEIGAVTTTGTNWNDKTTSIRTNYIRVVPNQTYEITYPSQVTLLQGVMYDKDKKTIAGSAFFGAQGKSVSITTSPECHYIRVSWIDYITSTIKEYQHDICIHLTHSGYRNGEYTPYEANTHLLPNINSILDSNGNQLFPYGLLSAGNVHDEITDTKAIKRIGVINMGALTWRINNEFGGYDATLETWRANNNERTLLTSKYSYKHWGYNGNDDKIICSIYYHSIFVRDSSYTSANEFKQAMLGVLLYYELATPIEVDLPEPLNITYEAWDFGTEELVAEGPTTPLNANIVYQFNAVDRIRENSKAIKNLEDRITGDGNIVSMEIVDSLDNNASNKALSARQGKILNETKQPLLTGDEFKTINGESIMGDGNIDIPKVQVVNDLTTGGIDKALSAEMGKVLKGMIPTKVSDLDNDEGYITEIPDTLADKTYVDTAIATAITTTLNTEV